jgi:hypothetical protein
MEIYIAGPGCLPRAVIDWKKENRTDNSEHFPNGSFLGLLLKSFHPLANTSCVRAL